MATYKAKKKVTIYYGTNSVLRTASATQEELAYSYEDLGATDESKKAAKKSSKNSTKK